MAVISATRAWGPIQTRSTFNRSFQRTYELLYRYECDNREDGPVTIRQSINPSTGKKWTPLMGSYYYVNATEFDAGAFVTDEDWTLESASANPEHATWLLKLSYGPFDTSLFGSNPLDWPPILWWGSHKNDKVIEADINDNAIVNSAGDRFSDPDVKDDSRDILFFQRNEAVSGFDPTFTGQYRDCINTADWVQGSVTFPQYSVKFSDRTIDKPVYDSNSQTYYYVATYTFEIDWKKKWKKIKLDQGFAVLDSGSPPKQKRLTDSKGQPLGEPTLLNGSGQELSPIGSTPVYLDFDVYDEIDFGVFNIDLTKCVGSPV
jgi:hypothetical protein